MPTWTLRVEDEFEAAHWLRSYRGEPEAVHGHSWKVEAVLETETLDDEGMGFDFVEIRRHLGELVGKFDHGEINRVPPFDEETPTTEKIAEHLFAELDKRLPDAGLVALTVWEGPHCSATYWP